jgi:hypothetical protein
MRPRTVVPPTSTGRGRGRLENQATPVAIENQVRWPAEPALDIRPRHARLTVLSIRPGDDVRGQCPQHGQRRERDCDQFPKIRKTRQPRRGGIASFIPSPSSGRPAGHGFRTHTLGSDRFFQRQLGRLPEQPARLMRRPPNPCALRSSSEYGATGERTQGASRQAPSWPVLPPPRQLASQPVQRARKPAPTFVQHGRVDRRRFYVCVAELLLGHTWMATHSVDRSQLGKAK